MSEAYGQNVRSSQRANRPTRADDEKPYAFATTFPKCLPRSIATKG